jgi:hypothetical protein
MQGPHFLWRHPAVTAGYRRGVCLHGHTLHSEECLWFLPRYLQLIPGIPQIGPRLWSGVDFARAWWTPPLTPASALALERDQIERLGLEAMVSLTDHDKIDAGLALQVACARQDTPVSVEWTLPYDSSILHIGVHNLPPGTDRSWMSEMAELTAEPHEALARDLLHALSELPGSLVVLNHPFWLEEGVSAEQHERALDRFLVECLDSIHAFELNGTRGWKENRDTIELAEFFGRPIISGGDRHACEPSACLNLTNSANFAEFAAEVRDGHSTVLFLPQYREPMTLRILEAAWDILRPYPEYPGRTHWSDRIFYRGEDGQGRPLSQIWNGHAPWPLDGAAGLVGLFAGTRLRTAIRLLLHNRSEVMP